MIRYVRLLVVCVVFICLYARAGETQDPVPAGLRFEFSARYEAWKQDCERVKHSSLLDSRLQSTNFQAKERVRDWWSKNRRRYVLPRGKMTTSDISHEASIPTNP